LIICILEWSELFEQLFDHFFDHYLDIKFCDVVTVRAKLVTLQQSKTDANFQLVLRSSSRARFSFSSVTPRQSSDRIHAMRHDPCWHCQQFDPLVHAMQCMQAGIYHGGARQHDISSEEAECCV
jgi:hypothetical protein